MELEESKKTAPVNPENKENDVPEEDVGDIRIADEVICIVASLAAQEVPGVLSMSGGLADGLSKLLGKENASKGVRLKFDGKLVTVNVYVIIEYGYNIPEVALTIQEKVKEAIENMTGYEVQFIDVNVEGVARRPDSDLEIAEEASDSMADVMREQSRRAEATVHNSFEMQLANFKEEAAAEELDERHRKFFEED